MRHRTRLPLLLAVLGMVGAAIPAVPMPADAQRPENAESARLGRRVAQRLCSRCHLTAREGVGPNPRAPSFPTIAERYSDANPASVLIDGTVVRHRGMPEFQLQENETDGLVAYLRRIARRRTP